MLILIALWITLLVSLSIQDWRHRKVKIWLIVSFMVISAGVGNFGQSTIQWLRILIINCFMLLGMWLLLVSYFSVTRRKWTTLIDSSIGSADILYLLGAASIFEPRQLLLFLCVGCTTAIIAHLVIRKLNKSISKKI